MIQLENYAGNTNYNLLEDDDIVNSLTNTSTNKALSANQGKTLKDFQTKLVNNETIKQLWSGSASDWANDIDIGVSLSDYEKLYFVIDTNNYIAEMDIPKNYNFATGESTYYVCAWCSNNQPVSLGFKVGSITGTILKGVVCQRWGWANNSSPVGITKIYGKLRIKE